MSVVAVKIEKDKIVISADSIRVSGWTQDKDKAAKLAKINGMVVGTAGKCEEFAMFLLFAKTHKPVTVDEYGITEYFSEFREWYGKKIGNGGVKVDNEYLLIINKKVFEIEAFYIRNVKTYAAIGAGRDYALTSLYLGHSPEESVEVACELSVLCEKPINTIEVKL